MNIDSKKVMELIEKAQYSPDQNIIISFKKGRFFNKLVVQRVRNLFISDYDIIEEEEI